MGICVLQFFLILLPLQASLVKSAKCIKCLICPPFINAMKSYTCIRLSVSQWGHHDFIANIKVAVVQHKNDLTFYFKLWRSVSSVLRIIEPLIHSKNRQIYVELSSRQQHRCGDGREFCIQWRIDKARGTLFLLFSWAKRTPLEARHQV